MKSAAQISQLLREQLGIIQDPKVRDHLRSLLIPPYASGRDWDYGPSRQKYVCWMVLEHPKSNTGIGYCSEGFGPRCPWGLLALEGSRTSMGMDCSWYDTLEGTYRESFAFNDLPLDN